ncbi:ABC transporter substrate-binding protein [Acidiphilium sp.]|uniref:ABC transporter substrate-binding protein n=1 Tax=Acidiphilium sp. TaxID=527 RepID=UPI003CFBE5F9
MRLIRPDPTRRALLGSAAAIIAPVVAMAAGATVPAHSASKVTLAALFPDQGAQALAGDEAWRGVALAVAAANRHRTDAIRLIRADAATLADPARGIARLAKASPPTALLGTLSSTTSFAATAAAELADLPYIELDAPADTLTARGFKMLIRTGLTTTDLAATTASTIIGQIAPAWHQPATTLRIALLFDVGASDGSFAAAMLGIAHRTNLPILLTLGYATDSMDLASEVGRMRRAKIDLLIHAGRTEHVLLLYQALAMAAWRPRMIIGVGPGYGMTVIGDALGRAIENTLVVDAPLYPPTGPAAAIAAAYRARYATSPRSGASLTSYVGTTLVIAAISAGEHLTTSLMAIHQPRGTLANGWGVAFSPDGQNRDSFATLQQWRGSRLVTVDPTIAGATKPILSL